MKLLHKDIFYDVKHPLYQREASQEMLEEDFEIKTGEWWYENGWIYGKNPGEFPGMIVSVKDYFGDIMIDFTGKTIYPSTHDINVMWNGCWDEEKDLRGTAYVAGIQGWWEGKVGIEKSPEYKLNVGTGLFDFKPGREYHIQAGSICGHCFIAVDGDVIIEVTDPEPINTMKYGRFGFEAYASWIAVKNVKVYSLLHNTVKRCYDREFV